MSRNKISTVLTDWKYDSTYSAVRLGHELLQFVDQTSYFLGILLHAAQLLDVKVRRDLLAENYL